MPEIDGAALLASLKEIAPKILPFAACAWRRLDEVRRQGKRILFEGAQAVLLDIDHGTYPYVTSSNTVAGQAAAGSGIGPRDIGYVLGIVKAYTTRVGEGPFPTELTDGIGERIGKIGAEFGTVTGRKRRCGWFDAVLVRQTVITGGIDGIALTKLDVLDGFDEIKLCTGYRLDGARSIICPPMRPNRRAACPSTKPWTAGRIDPRRAELGAIAGAGGQICAPRGGIDRRAGGAAVHQPGTRGHHPGARSLRGGRE